MKAAIALALALVGMVGCAGTPEEPGSLDAVMEAAHARQKEALCAAYREHHGISIAARGEVQFRYQGRTVKCRW